MAEIMELLTKMNVVDLADAFENEDDVFKLVVDNEKFTQEKIIDVLEILLDSHVKADIRNKEHKMVLQLAIKNRMKDVVNFLLRRKIDIDSIAHFFIEDENRKFRELLTTKNNYDELKLKIENIESESADFIEWLILQGFDFDYKNEENQSALSFAIECNLQHILPVLIKHTKDINSVDERNRTLLHLFLEKKDDYYDIKKNWYSKRYEIDIFKILLDKGVSVDAEDNVYCTPIRIAIAKKEDNEIVDMLIERSTNFHHKNAEGETLLHMVARKCAASKGTDTEYYMRIAQTLITRGANVNEQDEHGTTPVFYAIETPNLGLIDFFQKNGADFSVSTIYGETLMHMFIKNEHNMNDRIETKMKLFELLLENITNDHPKNADGETLLHTLIKKWATTKNADNDYYKRIASALLDNGANVNERDKLRRTPVYFAIEERSLCAVEFLRDNGADFGITVQGSTLLHLLMESKYYYEHVRDETEIKLFELILEEESNDVNMKNSKGKTLFHKAIKKWAWSKDKEYDYWMKVAHILIAKGADVNTRDYWGRTPVIDIIESCNFRIIEFLRENGADFSVVTKQGQSLMHLLAQYHSTDENEEVTKLFDMLISCDVDVNCRDCRQETPLLYLATKYDCDKTYMAKLLLEHGANVNSKNNEGFTALHKTVVDSRTDNNGKMLKFLLEYDADFNARTQAGCTVLQMALWYNYHIYRNEENIIVPSRIPNLATCVQKVENEKVEILLKHWIKLNVANLKCYTDDDYRWLINMRKYKVFHEKCTKEIETLKNTFIDSRTTLYNFLHLDPNSRRAFVSNDKWQNLLQSIKLDKQFPEYETLIWASYHETITRNTLLKPAKVAWLELTDIYLPDICIEHIFSFLSNSDLFDMIGK